MEQLKDWILGLTAAALLCAVATELTPKGPVKGMVRTICGVVMATALLGPLLTFDYDSYAKYLALDRAAAARVGEEAEQRAEELNRRVIAERFRAYILEKARTLGAEVQDAAVTLRWSNEGVWYPAAVELWGERNEALSDFLEGELGVPKSAQTWKDDKDGETDSAVAAE